VPAWHLQRIVSVGWRCSPHEAAVRSESLLATGPPAPRPVPGSLHVREAGLERATDEQLWEHARREGSVLVSKDSDFQQRSLLHGTPPKCIWIRVGSFTTAKIGRLVRDRVAGIREFVEHPSESYLILT
jgi:predicted nuclease of predicted toxin-antitoxin system